jgi:hypothetical protein
LFNAIGSTPMNLQQYYNLLQSAAQWYDETVNIPP